jgi:hypothetical protein
MTATDQRSSAYASLRAVADAATGTSDAGAAAASAAPNSVDNPWWNQEAEKLDTLLQSLWRGYVDAPSNGLPTPLSEYVSTYTSTMRLKLTLLANATTARRTFKTASPLNGKGKAP